MRVEIESLHLHSQAILRTVHQESLSRMRGLTTREILHLLKNGVSHDGI